MVVPGMDKVQEREAPLPGKGKVNCGNHYIMKRSFHFKTLLLREKSLYPLLGSSDVNYSKL